MALWRRIILLLVVACGAARVGCAQGYVPYRNLKPADDAINRSVEMGVVLGANYLGIEPSADVLTLSPKAGFRGGLQMSLVWEQKYALQMEVAYAFNKVDSSLGERKAELRSNIVEVPVMFSYRGLNPVRIGAGVVFAPVASGRYDVAAERVEFGQLRQMVGWVADVGVKLTSHLLLDARFVGCFGGVDNYFEGLEFRSRSWQASFSLGYMF